MRPLFLWAAASVLFVAIAAETPVVPWNGSLPSATSDAPQSNSLSVNALLAHPHVTWTRIQPVMAGALIPTTATEVYVVGIQRDASQLPVQARLLFREHNAWFATRPIDELVNENSARAGDAQRAAALAVAAFAAGL